MSFSKPCDATHRSTTVYFLLLCATFVVVFYVFGHTIDFPDEFLAHHHDPNQSGVAKLDVYIPHGRKDDLYQNVNIVFDGQSLPLSLDSSTADTFIASDDCDTFSRDSGCYEVEELFKINEETNFIPDEGFDTYLGKGRVIGNLSATHMHANGVTSSNITAAIIHYAMRDEFQNGSFSGILGLGLRQASQQWLNHQRLPFIDTLILEKKLRSPMLSLTSPRYGDQDQKLGRMTFGAIDANAPADVAFNDVMPFSRNPDRLENLETVAWSSSLQGIRINGAEVAVTPGRLRADEQHISILDSGASYIYLRTPDFYAVTPHFHGLTIIEPDPTGDKVYYECERPQILELKLHNRWYPIEPLDILVPNSHIHLNGSQMCQASIRTWDMTTFGDSLLGLPFLRSVLAVFDYVSPEMYSVPPRLGLASMVDTKGANRRYQDKYMRRLQ